MVQVRRETNKWFSGIRTAVFKPSPLLKDEPPSGLVCSGISKPRRISAFSGPAAGGGYLLPERQKVKIRRIGRGSVNRRLAGRCARFPSSGQAKPPWPLSADNPSILRRAFSFSLHVVAGVKISLTLREQDFARRAGRIMKGESHAKPGRGYSRTCLPPMDRRWSTRGPGRRLLVECPTRNFDNVTWKRCCGFSSPRRGVGCHEAREEGEGRPVGKKQDPGCVVPSSLVTHDPDDDDATSGGVRLPHCPRLGRAFAPITVEDCQLIDLAGRSGRARTCDPRFWSTMEYVPAGVSLSLYVSAAAVS